MRIVHRTLPHAAPAPLVEYFARHTEVRRTTIAAICVAFSRECQQYSGGQAMDKLIAQDFDGCLAILEEQKKINGEPADVSKRRPEHHQGVSRSRYSSLKTARLSG